MTGTLATAALDLVCTWGAYVFGLFLVQSARASPPRDAPVRGGGLWTAYGLACLALYLHPLAGELLALHGGAGAERWRDVTNVAVLCAAFLLPALLAHLFLRMERPHLPVPRLFGAAVIALDLACGGLLALWVAGGLGRYGWTAEPHLEPVAALTAASSGLVMAMELMARARDGSPGLARPRVVYLALAALSAAAAVLSLRPLPGPARAAVGLAALALPILFVLAMAYLHARAAMFDRLAKWGLFSLVALLGLWALRALLGPGPLAAPGAWILPAGALPLLLLAPWAYGRISSRIDRRWLGRPRSPSQAHQDFLSALGASGDEGELLRLAERRLAELLPAAAGAPRVVRVELGPGASDLPRIRPGAFEAPVISGGRPVGTMRVETPAWDRPFLSEDRELLASLGQTLGVALDNLRLREGRAAQERREEQLTLCASRAELRALRAQIDPHFLFNALNAIAALIPRDAARAEAVVERLAEVFRYTLRRSGREWVRLEDELEFVRAYLEVEQARFGRRLAVEYRIAGAAAEAFVPAMMLSVLVENAVKHGVARVRGPARLEVVAAEEGGRIRMEVKDSGPGFPAGGWSEAPPGHGLRNTRERLRGHFGAEARLEATREVETGLTVVGITLPRVTAPPAEAAVPP